MSNPAPVVPNTTQALIVVKSKPAMLKVNFAELKAHLQTELQKYDLVVTQDTVKGAKELATELNKLAGEIDSRRKEEVASVSEPIKLFDSQMRELVTLTQEGREKLLDQIKKFEDETRRLCEDLLAWHRKDRWDEFGVGDEYRKAGYGDLIMISNVTAAGFLTQKARDTLTLRCRDDLARQDKVNMRLIMLENASLRAGLSTPLTRIHVAHFLEADDATYGVQLQRLIDAEVQRQEAAEEAMRDKMEKERLQKEERDRLEQERQARIDTPLPRIPPTQITTAPAAAKTLPRAPEAPVQAVKSEEPPPSNVPEGKKYYFITATFEILAPEWVTADKVKTKLEERLTAAGITSLKSIIVSA